MTSTTQRTYSSRELAIKLGISQLTLFRWERDHKIKAPARAPRTNARVYTESEVAVIERFKINGTTEEK